jgi:MoxR-like ATPase
MDAFHTAYKLCSLQVVLLDSVERVGGETLATLSQLLLDGHCVLPDGTRIIPQYTYNSLIHTHPEVIGQVLPLHPAFRVIALASTLQPNEMYGWKMFNRVFNHTDALPTGPSKPFSLLHPEVLPMLNWHVFPHLSNAETAEIITHWAKKKAAPGALSSTTVPLLVDVRRSLAETAQGFAVEDPASAALCELSLRHIIRIARNVASVPSEGLGRVRQNILESIGHDVLPPNMKKAILQCLNAFPALRLPPAGVPPTQEDGTPAAATPLTIEQSTSIDGGRVVRIGDVGLQAGPPLHPHLVPRTLFYHIPQHVQRLQDIMLDWRNGEKHVMLLGSQGTGKNKLIDYLLQMLNREREYIQLHRDTTVSSLTVQPVVEEGMVRWEDAPLVRAARYGRVLVIDEADKAPSEVTVILKGLVEDGEMYLADGRVLQTPRKADSAGGVDSNVIPIHPDFHIVCLANRPGWPFLGNNVLTSGLAHSFSCHWIANPDTESELSLLKQYAPDLHPAVSRALVDAFAALRALNEAGQLSYPYSMREIVLIARHLHQFPSDDVGSAVENVLAFDSFDSHARSKAEQVFSEHGIKFGVKDERLRALNGTPIVTLPLQPPVRRFSTSTRTASSGSTAAVHKGSVRCKIWHPDDDIVSSLITGDSTYFPIQQGRTSTFGSLKARFNILPATSSSNGVIVQSEGMCGPNTRTLAALSNKPWNMHVVGGLASRGSHLLQDVYGQYPQRSYRSILLGRAAVMPWTMGGLKEAFTGAPRQQASGDPVMCAVANSSECAVLLPENGCVLLVDALSLIQQKGASRTTALVVEVPELLGRGKMLQSSNGSAWRISAGWFGGNINVCCWKNGSNEFAVIRVPVDAMPSNNTVQAQVAALEAGLADTVQSIKAVNENHILVYGKQKTLMYDINTGKLTEPGATTTFSHQSVDVITKESKDTSQVLRDAVTQVSKMLKHSNRQTAVLHSVWQARDGTRCLLTKNDASADVIHVGYVSSSDAANEKEKPFLHIPQASHVIGTHLMGASDMAVVYQNGTIAMMQVPSPAMLTDLECWMASQGLLTHKTRQSTLTDIITASNTALDWNTIPDTAAGLVARWKGGEETGPILTFSAANTNQMKWMSSGFKHGTTDGKVRVNIADEASGSVRTEYGKKKGVGEASERPPPLSSPSHGKIDETGAPHVGGNTWAGGSGGSNTAGLGGRGGPYRLDGGNPVHQVSDDLKNNTPAGMQEAARRMAEEAFAARMKEIHMSSRDASRYHAILSSIESDIVQLRSVLAGAQQAEAERTWMKHQSYGEIDDAKIVDGVTGDRQIFKRRGDVNPLDSPSPLKPTYLCFAFDCSGSMYRFNGVDGRLDRSLQVAAMIMEAFAGFEAKFRYSFIGHSGDTANIPLVPYDSPPANAQERLRVLDTMAAHTQFCMSGDNTLQAAVSAGKSVADQRAAAEQGRFMFLLSDANLHRYGIRPQQLTSALLSNPSVNAYAFFLGPGLDHDETDEIVAELPRGRGHAVYQPGSLPPLFRDIFTSHFAAKY